MAAVMRFVSLILIVMAIGLLGADLVSSLERHGMIVVRSVAEVWSLIDKGGLAASQAWAQHALPAPLTRLFAMLLSTWSWVVVGIPGIVLVFLFDRRQPGQA
jgi:hypothetical protein